MDVPSRLTVKQAAAYCSVCESVVRGWVSSGKLPHYRLGLGRGKIVIDREDLDALLATFKVGARESEPAESPAPSLASFKHLKLG